MAAQTTCARQRTSRPHGGAYNLRKLLASFNVPAHCFVQPRQVLVTILKHGLKPIGKARGSHLALYGFFESELWDAGEALGGLTKTLCNPCRLVRTQICDLTPPFATQSTGQPTLHCSGNGYSVFDKKS